jgi:hypothetical protein
VSEKPISYLTLFTDLARALTWLHPVHSLWVLTHVVCATAVMMEIWGSFEMSVNFRQALVCGDSILLKGME